MKIAHLCSPDVRVVSPDQPLADAATVMCEQHIGALVVVDSNDTQRRPIGILTDRDVVRGQFTRSADLYCLTVGDVMTRNPVILNGELQLSQAIALLSAHAVRRAPVVDSAGRLSGFVSLDDLMPALAAEITAIAQLMGGQSGREHASQG